jgi:Icc-related predicted phosphoesterase
MSKSLVIVSDTHGLHGAVEIPPGDILVHAGDLTMRGELEGLADFNAYLGTLPHPVKIVIAGNHDFCFEREPAESRRILTNAIYLEDEAITMDGIRLYGSPWQPWFFDWAFNLQRGPEIKAKWDRIPSDTDILVTHGPPLGFGDRTVAEQDVGCRDLLDAVERIAPALHIFGHIHEGYGVFSNDRTTFINASTCNPSYEPVNRPIVRAWGP